MDWGRVTPGLRCACPGLTNIAPSAQITDPGLVPTTGALRGLPIDGARRASAASGQRLCMFEANLSKALLWRGEMLPSCSAGGGPPGSRQEGGGSGVNKRHRLARAASSCGATLDQVKRETARAARWQSACHAAASSSRSAAAASASTSASTVPS
jgi:hypothetical protein